MTDDPNARPSLSERYSVAVSSGTGLEHMILAAGMQHMILAAGMQHMILAAGMQHERLGAVLLRLQSEYDAVKGDLERAGQIAPQRTAQARDLVRRAALAERLKDHGTAATLKALAADIRERTPVEVRRQCSTSAGSGHRRDIIGRSPAERIFARDLLAELQRRVAAAAGGMGQALAPPEASTPDAGELRSMQGRLDNMRAAAAQTD